MKKSIKLFFSCFIYLFLQNAFAVDSGLNKTQHPGAADGLTRIDANGVYIYDVPTQLRNQSSHIRVGASTNPDITVDICKREGTNDCASITKVNFDDIYEGASKTTFGYDYEYFFTLSGGKFGAQLGFAAQYAQGRGRLVIDPSISSQEKFSFLTLPLYAGGVYRFEYKDKQIVAPYVAGGGVLVGLIEKREDRSKINAISALGFYGTAGLLLNVTAFDREMASDFESEYGVSNLWLNLEFKTVQVSSEAFNYQSGFIQGGLSLDF